LRKRRDINHKTTGLKLKNAAKSNLEICFFFFFVWNENFIKNKKEICLSTLSLKSNLQSHDGKYQIFGEMICRAKQS
jgi:hypothetical protein